MFPPTRQEESSSISQASRPGIVYRFREGKVRVNHNEFLGYTKDEEGEFVIDPKQAETVKRIFTEYLDGKSYKRIAEDLERDGVALALVVSGGTKTPFAKSFAMRNTWEMPCCKRRIR